MSSVLLNENIKNMNYKKWVSWSNKQLKDKSPDFLQEIERFQKLAPQFIVKENPEWRGIDLIRGPTNKGYYNVLHHFSGRVDEKNKFVFFMLNPKLGDHIVKEFEIERQIGYWELSRKKYSLIQEYGKEYSGKQWTSMKAISQLVGTIIGEIPKNYSKSNMDEIWQLLDKNVVIIDVLPYFSNNIEEGQNSEFRNLFQEYLMQTLKVFMDPSLIPEPKYIFFLGKVFRDIPAIDVGPRKRMWLKNRLPIQQKSYFLNFPRSYYGSSFCQEIADYLKTQEV